MDIFLEARNLVSEPVIKKYFYSDDSFVSCREYFIKSPLRVDNHAGSFCVNLDTGYYIDNARSGVEGDFIDLVSKAFNLSLKDAAEKIVSENSGMIIEQKEKTEKPKYEPVLNIPKEAFELFDKHVNNKFIVEKIGKPVKAWRYIKDNQCWCVVARHEIEGKKNVKPYHFGNDNKWHSGNPLKKDYPPFNIDKIADNKKILIVEGEKCASVDVDGFAVISWVGGSSQILKTDWSVLSEREDVFFWPDNDEPGYKCALELKQKYPKIKILKCHDFPDKYDIVDAKKDGIDLQKFILESKEYGNMTVNNYIDENNIKAEENNENKNEIENAPFKFLGYEESKHYFIPNGFDIVRKFSAGSLSKSKLLELAPLAWWNREFPKNTKNALGADWDSAIDWVIQSSRRAGMFDKDLIRGAGFWREDDGSILINSGRKTHDKYGNDIKINSDYHYVKSSRQVDNYSGAIATKQESLDLFELFAAQNFESDYISACVLGWSLIAPLCGLLSWRPHIWITGASGMGKSYIIDNLVKPIVGKFQYNGSGENTAASFIRSLGNDSCPTVLDEVEVNAQKTKEGNANIYKLVELARNASSDSSAKKTLCGEDGSVGEYYYRTACCFGSVMPVISGNAQESRFIVCRLKSLPEEQNKLKYKITSEFIEKGVLNDTGKYRRKILQNIELFFEITEKFKIELGKKGVVKRISDNLAPIFAALMVIMESENIEKFVNLIVGNIFENHTAEEDDEDKVLTAIFDSKIMTDDRDIVAISELLQVCKEKSLAPEKHSKLLARNGIKFFDYNGLNCLAIVQKSSSISELLRNTHYIENYKEVLRRHPSLVKETHSVNISGLTKRCILLNWKKIEEKYFSIDSITEDEKDKILSEVL